MQVEAVLGLEFLLSFLVVLAHLRATDPREPAHAAAAAGVSYTAAIASCRAAALNPAWALGRAFVVNNFKDLWVIETLYFFSSL